MKDQKTACLYLIFLLSFCSTHAQKLQEQIKTDFVTISVEQRYDAVRPGGNSAFALLFKLQEGWHFYASPESAPGGMNLKLTPESAAAQYINFSEPLLPRFETYFDKTLKQELEVFSGTFTIFIPFEITNDIPTKEKEITAPVQIALEGAICSEMQCRVPDFEKLKTTVTISPSADMSRPKFTLPQIPAAGGETEISTSRWSKYPIWLVFIISIGVGMAFNIMPCVWPVLPLIIMRLVEQAKHSRGKTITMGMIFCTGIILFFAALAALNIILRLFYGTVLQWGDQFRDPVFLGFMVLLLVTLALFMFDVFTIIVPASVTSKSGKAKGLSGALGMGFLAAILSTPCSFGILAAVFAWAQGQNLFLSTLVLLFIGLGMAVPYAILTPFSGFLKHLPKGGRWMELFKQALGFLFLLIAVWLLSALPADIRINVMYFAILLAFCVWMWGTWITFSTPASKRWAVRTAAVVIAVAGGLILLPPQEKKIDWQKYDANKIKLAQENSRPVIIKFTAEWCLSCKVVDKAVFSRRTIAKLIKQKNVLPVKADTTSKNSPATIALKNTYNEPGVPVTILLLPDKKETIRWHSKFFADELKEHLEKFPSK